LDANIAASAWVDKAVVLAMDGLIDSEGSVDRENTQIYIPNEYVVKDIARYDNLLFGASINPKRRDALQRLEQAKANGAVLVKWIPCIMGIEPDSPSMVPFYRKLIELELPLLTHAGRERSFAHSCDKLCDPQKLVTALELGFQLSPPTSRLPERMPVSPILSGPCRCSSVTRIFIPIFRALLRLTSWGI
jgi:hypothetical protein